MKLANLDDRAALVIGDAVAALRPCRTGGSVPT